MQLDVLEQIDADFDEELRRALLKAASSGEMELAIWDIHWLLSPFGWPTAFEYVAPGDTLVVCTPFGPARIRVAK